MNEPKTDVSIILPCYMEEPHLLSHVETILLYMQKTKYSFEIILVDDCSTDKTREIILECAGRFSGIKYLFHVENTGRGKTFMDGIWLAQGKFIGYFDIDLEVSYAYIVPVVMCLEQGADVAIVKRHYSLSPDPSFILRHILSTGYKFLTSRMLKIPRMDTESGFKFFERNCLLNLAPLIQNNHWFFDTEIMAFTHLKGYKIKEVDGLFIRRSDKKSTVKVVRDTLLYFIELFKFKKRLSGFRKKE